jgi:hypothetical protein
MRTLNADTAYHEPAHDPARYAHLDADAEPQLQIHMTAARRMCGQQDECTMFARLRASVQRGSQRQARALPWREQ